MDRIFNMDNKFFQFMGRLADLMLLNVLCIVCCIPIITASTSIAAMYYVTLKMVRDEESYITKSFFHSFKQNFKQGILISLIMVAALVLLYIDTSIARSMEGSIGRILSVMFMAMALFYLIIFIYIHPLLAKFSNTTREMFFNALLMGIRHLPYTALMVLITAIPLLILFIPSAQVQMTLLMVLVLLGIPSIAFAKSYFLRKIFDQYIPKTEEDGEAGSEDAPDLDPPAPTDSAEER